MLLAFKQECDTFGCASINCALTPSDISQVNVSLRVWKPTIIKVSKKSGKNKPVFVMFTEIISLIFLSAYSSSVKK